MNQWKDNLKLLVFILFMILLGGYYERLSLETRTMLLPLAIFAAVTITFIYFKRLQYEMRSSNIFAYKIVAKEFSLVDGNYNERFSISSDHSKMTFYDEDHVPRATLEMFGKEPVLKLIGEKGRTELAFNSEGVPSVTLRGEADKIVWTAP